MIIAQPSAARLDPRPGTMGWDDLDSKPPREAPGALLRRIMEFQLDNPRSQLPFSLRLARENGWSRHFAIRVIEEYKRFCYLAMTAGHAPSPSDEVDQAWHLHLLYTKSYWDDFCGGVLERPLHHSPTRGGPDESARFRDAYRRTLASYRRVFGSDPPRDIWPAVDTRFANAKAFRRVDTSAVWLMPKLRWHLPRHVDRDERKWEQEG